MENNKKVLLIIRDGWGYRFSKKHNAIKSTKTPNTDFLMKNFPHTLLKASNGAVGLPKKYQGNSEVGHMTIGSGRIINQSLERINDSIKNKSFFENEKFLGAINNCKENNTNLHIIGLLQNEGVHAHINHLYALIELCKKENFSKVKLHLITDGRDAPINASIKKVKELIKKTNIEISTISGRFYAMDRDKRWDRTKKAYDTIVMGKSKIEYDDPLKTIQESYNNNITDEFIIPRQKKGYNGINPKDSIIFFNFRTDRTRQLTKAIVENEFDGWYRNPLDVYFVAMTQYYTPMNANIAFEEQHLTNLLGKIISSNNLKQLRISETEKYAHVTFFFNGQEENPYENEDRILIHSPKVQTYDLKPEMSVYEITEKLNEQIKTNKYDFIVTNLVNGDMVGHTGIVPAIKKAIKAVDDCLGKIVKTAFDNNYEILIIADHGNCEDQRPKWRTSHTINPVPFIFISKDTSIKLKSGGLQDIAPTILDLIEIEKPKEMNGYSLLKKE